MPAILNLVLLQPGHAMFVPAGVLHAYLDGTGIELMANSDNVLRCGLTAKHVDVPELLKLLTFADGDIEIMKPVTNTPGEQIYTQKTKESSLSVLTPAPNMSYIAPAEHGIEIMICTKGQASLKSLNSEDAIEIRKGTSVLVPAATEEYEIKGNATIYRASVPA
jgi:mannose-6-phosphate isomerase